MNVTHNRESMNGGKGFHLSVRNPHTPETTDESASDEVAPAADMMAHKWKKTRKYADKCLKFGVSFYLLDIFTKLKSARLQHTHTQVIPLVLAPSLHPFRTPFNVENSEDLWIRGVRLITLHPVNRVHSFIYGADIGTKSLGCSTCRQN